MSFIGKDNQDRLCNSNASRSGGGMNVPDIKQLLTQYGLSTAGTRQALKTRLCDYLRSHPAAAPGQARQARQAGQAGQAREGPGREMLEKFRAIDAEYFKDINDDYMRRNPRYSGNFINIEPWYIYLHVETGIGPGQFGHKIIPSPPITEGQLRIYGQANLDKIKQVVRLRDSGNLPDERVQFDPVDLVSLSSFGNDILPRVIELNDHGGLNKTIIMDHFPDDFVELWYPYIAFVAIRDKDRREDTETRVRGSTPLRQVSRSDIEVTIPPEYVEAMIRLHDRNGGLNASLIGIYFNPAAATVYNLPYSSRYGDSNHYGNWLSTQFNDTVRESEYRVAQGAAYRISVRDQSYWDSLNLSLHSFMQSYYQEHEAFRSQVVQQWQQQQEQQQWQQQQWQQQQEQDYTQTPQQFEAKAALTREKVNTYGNVAAEFDSYTYIPTTQPDHEFGFMLDTIYEMENTCRTMILQEGACSRDGKRVPGPLLAKFWGMKGWSGTLSLRIKWDTEGGDLMNTKYYAKLLANRAMVKDRLTFTLDSNLNVGIDEGGVSRAVFTKAGDYIKSILRKGDGGRYYLKARMPKGSDKLIAGCISSSIRQGHVLGVPLSYGLLYCIQRGAVPSCSDVPLPTLMALYRMDDSEGLRVLLETIKDQHSLEFVAPYNERTDAVLPESADSYDLSETNKFEWLRRILFDKLFLYKGHLTRLMHKDNWYLDEPELVRGARLEDLSIILGTVLTAEIMSNIKFTGRPEIVQLVRKFLKENPKYWEAFLKFVTGSVSPEQTVTIHATQIKGLPISHTCSTTLEIYAYDDYPSFAKDMIISLENSEGFGAA